MLMHEEPRLRKQKFGPIENSTVRVIVSDPVGDTVVVEYPYQSDYGSMIAAKAIAFAEEKGEL